MKHFKAKGSTAVLDINGSYDSVRGHDDQMIVFHYHIICHLPVITLI